MTRLPKPLRRAEAWQGRHSTIRMRIALVYGGVFLVLGTALLATVNLASRAGTDSQARAIATSAAVAQPGFAVNGPLHNRGRLGPPTVYDVTDDVSDAASRELLYWSVAALLVMTGCAVAVGWWTAGRVLRPVHAMTAKARKLSEHTLHERIAAGGPDDELKELGETLDALLARLEKAFDSQRRFIANASHEL
ncbi:MAG TPA: two-component sensor histidine kinase, partial [Streptomyces sp.]|nr:two-component sensor histidine kinase [Streptomyces sp.]